MICSQCRGEIPAGARYCPSCGLATSAPDDERRIVTVLFADIVGFTTLSETLDPERVKRLVDSWFERLVTDITDFGGRVDKIVGDGVLALFGAPVAHEDDAERAVRAALRMQETLADMAARATSGPGPRVQMRIGVNTGEVLVGAMRADGVITAMGDVVNTASRLQTAARPGEVLVGPTTHRLTVHAIASERRGLLTARGRDAPVEAWSAVRALLPPGQRPDRDQMPLVGRSRELGLLDAGVAAGLGHQRAFLGIVVGDTGVGKSRLVREAAERIGAGGELLRLEGRCVPYGEANVWWPLAEALQSLCEVEPAEEVPRVRDAVWARVAAALGDDAPEKELDRVTAGLMVLMGHDASVGRRDPGDAREEAVDAFVTFLEGHLRRRPVVLQLSDIHWADDDLLGLLEVLLSRLARCPLVILATARQAVRAHWNPPPGRHDVIIINLDPLDDGPAGELLVALHGGEVTAGVRADLLARSGGNPFFLEELVALMDSAEPGAVPPRLPDTLRGIVTARLDTLGPAERDVLTDAAVIGRRGPVSALREMAEEMGRAVDVDGVVATLAANELLDVEDRHWEFRSEMAREVAYATLTKSVRTKRHAGIAAWLEARTLEAVDADVDLDVSGAADALAGLAEVDDATVNRIAHHWAAAAELTAEMGEGPVDGGRVVDRAVAWLAASARRAQRRDLLPAAERAYDRALALAGSVPISRRTRLLVSRSRVRADGWDLVGAREDAEAALAGAATDGDRSIEAAAVLRLGDIDQRSGDTSAAIARLRHAADRFTTEGDDRGRGEALRLLGMAQMFAGRLDEAMASIDEAGTAFTRADDRSGQGWAEQNRAWVAMLAGDLDTTEEAVGRAVSLFAGVDDTVGRAWSMGLLAFVRFAQGRREEAEVLATSILEEATTSGDRWAVAMMRGLVGSLRLWSGRVADALAETALACQGFRDLGDPWGLAVSLATHGRALAMSGQVDEGFAAIASSDDGAEERSSDVVAMATLALAVQVGEPERAGATVDGDAPRAGGTMGQTEGEVTFALAQLQCGRVVEVPAAGDRAYGLAASALVAAARGRGAEALERAEAVEDCPEATYLDRALGHLAAGMAEVRAGRAEVGLARVERAAELVDATDDLVGRAMVALARAVVAEVTGAPSAVQDRSVAAIAAARLGLTSEGWETAFALAAGSRPRAGVR